ASMPSELTTRWMSTAPAGPARTTGAKSKPNPAASDLMFMDRLRGSGRALLGRADQVAGHRPADVEVLPGGGVDLLDGDGIDGGRPILRLLDGLAAGERHAEGAGERGRTVLCIDGRRDQPALGA